MRRILKSAVFDLLLLHVYSVENRAMIVAVVHAANIVEETFDMYAVILDTSSVQPRTQFSPA